MQTGAAQWPCSLREVTGPRARSGQVTRRDRDWQVSGSLSSEVSQAASRRGLPSVGNLRNLSSWQRLGTSKWPAQPLRRPRTGACRTARGAGAIIAAIDST